MSDRQPGPARGSEASSQAQRTALRRVRVMSSGRWHAPLGPAPLIERRPTRIVAIGSATPGVGKSVVASNLAVAIAGLGRQVVLVDLDLRTPRLHALFGIVPQPGAVESWLENRGDRVDELASATGVRNLRIMPSLTAPGARLDSEGRGALVQELNDIESDVVVVDLGDDNREDLFDFFATQATRLLVTSRDRQALEATYGFLKSATRRAARRHGAGAAAALAQYCGGLVGNATAAPEDEESLHAFSRLVREHLGIPVPVVGCLRTSERIAQSIVARKPLVARRGVDDNVRVFHQMAELLTAELFSGAARACALENGIGDFEGPPSPQPLPAEIARYARQYPRFPVDWTATLDLGNGVTAVRIRDVSESGVALETALALRLGDRGVLHFDQLPGQPALSVTVKNVLPALRRVGLGFVAGGQPAAEIAAAARKHTLGSSAPLPERAVR